jgi:Flp pilus assembly protein TadB
MQRGIPASVRRLLRRSLSVCPKAEEEGRAMLFLLLFLLLIAVVIGLGFIVRTLFYVAVVLALIWVILYFWRNIRGRR